MSDIYKQGLKQGLRFTTSVGSVTIEQLFDLSIPQLDKLAVSLDEAVNKGTKKSFVETPTAENEKAKLAFDIVFDILQDKLKYAEAAKKAKETKEQNQIILGLIQSKKIESLGNKSIEELQAMIQ